MEQQKYHPWLSILVSARKNSKYLSKFIAGERLNTIYKAPPNMEMLIMLNEHDTWNSDLVELTNREQRELYKGSYITPITFVRENMRLGRAGLHLYFNELLKYAQGDWIVYFCEDHYINQPGWNVQIMETILGAVKHGDSANKQFPLDPNEVWVIVPKFDNCGAMNHIVSRGFVEALAKQRKSSLGNHGWIDSYINDLMRDFPDRVIRMDEPLFHDFTHDQPNPMTEAHSQGGSSIKGLKLPFYDSSETKRLLELDKQKLIKAISRR